MRSAKDILVDFKGVLDEAEEQLHPMTLGEISELSDVQQCQIFEAMRIASLLRETLKEWNGE
jgi:hypothetical protein